MGGQKSLSAACPIAECAVEIVVEVAGQDQSGGGVPPPPRGILPRARPPLAAGPPNSPHFSHSGRVRNPALQELPAH